MKTDAMKLFWAILLLLSAIAMAKKKKKKKNLHQEHHTLGCLECVKPGGNCVDSSECCDGPDKPHYVCCDVSNSHPSKKAKSTCVVGPCNEN
jgi:hypothetical protein